jgi:hypothetical protein
MNYEGIARTNYFHVKNLAAFQAAMAPLEVTVSGKTSSAPQEGALVCVLTYGESGWPSDYFDEQANEYVEVDMAELIGAH